MANKYVYSGAGGAGTGADWANAYTTLTLAIAGSAAGDDLWVAHDHAESSGAGVTLSFTGTSASPNRVFCVDRAGTVPPVSADLRTTATVTVTNGNILIDKFVYIYGVIFNAGSGASASDISIGTVSSSFITLENCALKLITTSAGQRMYFSSVTNNTSQVTLVNTTVTFGSTSQAMRVTPGRLVWRNTPTAVGGATFPTNLFDYGAGASLGEVILHGVDLSALGAGKTIVIGGFNYGHKFILHDCKLNASVTISGTANGPGGAVVYVTRSASSGISYTHEKHGDYLGQETVETTIVRTGGAVVNGTALAKKYVTTANCKVHQPFITIPIAVANSTTGSNRVVSVYGVWGGGAVPTNADIWFEVGYLGSAASPQASFKSAGKVDLLATASNHSTDTSTWGGSTTKFQMSVTLSSPQPAMSGEMYVQIYCGAASSTFYIDPKVVLS